MSEQQLRLMKLMERPFRLHEEDMFNSPGAESLVMSPIPDYEKFLNEREKLQAARTEAIFELRVCYEEPLLSRAQEYHWFRQFNFLKHKANCLFQRIDLIDPVASDVGVIEELVSQLSIVKHQLAASNVRLVISLAKKQQDYVINPSLSLLTEIISDGFIGLMRAIDYYDYRLGNKFGTYATWAIRRVMKSCRLNRVKYVEHFPSEFDDMLCKVAEEVQGELEDVPISVLIQRLPTRQRKAIVLYYYERRNLRQIGEELGITKERVRQIKARGLEKLRNMLNARN